MRRVKQAWDSKRAKDPTTAFGMTNRKDSGFRLLRPVSKLCHLDFRSDSGVCVGLTIIRGFAFYS